MSDEFNLNYEVKKFFVIFLVDKMLDNAIDKKSAEKL